MAYGNTSVSALLNQARAALKKQQGLEEQIAAYEYDLSPKDQAAWQKYNDFLGNRVKQVQATDPSKALSLQRLQTGANRTFTSSEIQRQSINILEGGGSKQQKLNTMINLYRKAIENGDENLAQRLQLQADTLQQTIMNEAMAGAGRGGGGGSSTNPQVKGFKEAKSDYQNYVDHLEEELRSGHITAKEYIMGGVDKKTGKPFTGLRDTMQQLEGVRQNAYDYAQQTGDQDAINFYGDLSGTMKSDRYQSFINQAGTKIDAGQVPGARQYNYNTGQWEFKPNTGENGYVNTPLGAQFKLKDESNSNFVGTDQNGMPIWLPKNQMNNLTEVKNDKDTIVGNQRSGFLPGYENSKSIDFGNGRILNPNELIFTQNEKGETSSLFPAMAATDPRTGQFVRGDNGQIRTIRPEDLGATGAISNDPIVGGLQRAGNAVLDPLVADAKASGATDVVDYGKKKASEVLNKAGIGKTADTLRKQLGSFGITNPFATLAANGPGFNSFGVIQGLQNKVKDMQKQAEAKAAAEAAQRAAELQAWQRTVAQTQAEQQAIKARAAAAHNNTVLTQSAPFNANNYSSPDTRAIAAIQYGLDSPFSRAGVGSNSLYRLKGF